MRGIAVGNRGQYRRWDQVPNGLNKYSLPYVQSIFSAAWRTAKLKRTLSENGKTFTIFAPSDEALEEAFKDARLICVHDFYKSRPCTSTADLLSSTNLKAILLNFGKHVRGEL